MSLLVTQVHSVAYESLPSLDKFMLYRLAQLQGEVRSGHSACAAAAAHLPAPAAALTVVRGERPEWLYCSRSHPTAPHMPPVLHC